MITVAVNEQTLTRLTKSLGDKFIHNVEIANREIASDWAALLINQQSRFHRSARWAPLDEDYAARKRREYRKTDVRYLTTLKRTGTMMAGYLEGIQSNVKFADGSLGVTLQFPEGKVGVRAMSHQGVIPQPAGVKPRPFNIEEFQDLAVEKITAAINKSLDE